MSNDLNKTKPRLTKEKLKNFEISAKRYFGCTNAF